MLVTSRRTKFESSITFKTNRICQCISVCELKYILGAIIWAVWTILGAASGCPGEAHLYSHICYCSKGEKVQAERAFGKARTFPLEWFSPTTLARSVDWEHTLEKWPSAVRTAASRLSPHRGSRVSGVWSLPHVFLGYSC